MKSIARTKEQSEEEEVIEDNLSDDGFDTL
jgi:hypothetical protein